MEVIPLYLLSGLNKLMQKKHLECSVADIKAGYVGGHY